MKLYPVLFFSIAFFFFACQTEDNGKYQQADFKVWGNCEMCKETIEASLKDEKGVQQADWNVKSKVMTVQYDSAAVNLQTIHEKIASAGYDTELEKGDDKAYSSLHSCCQYKRKE